MVEAALKELHIENVVLGNTRLADLVTKSPMWSATNPSLPSKVPSSPALSRSNSQAALHPQSPPSPVRVTPSASRQVLPPPPPFCTMKLGVLLRPNEGQRGWLFCPPPPPMSWAIDVNRAGMLYTTIALRFLASLWETTGHRPFQEGCGFPLAEIPDLPGTNFGEGHSYAWIPNAACNKPFAQNLY